MKKINISQIDTVFVNGSYPIEFLFFYKNKIETPKISKALKKISATFWPVFGKYSDGFIHSEKYSQDKFFQEIVYKDDFSQVKNEMDIWEKYNRVNPGKMNGLFFLSVLQFNNGTVIIPKMNHLVGDGYSYFYFLSVLAVMIQPSYIPFKNHVFGLLAAPQSKRTSLRDFHFKKRNIEEPAEHQNCTIRIEKVPKSFVKEEIKKIKSRYDQIVSTNDILSAIVFKKIAGLHKDPIDKHFSLSIPMDVRHQVKELGPRFFGNGLMFHHFELSTTELNEIDTEQLAIKVRKSMPEVSTKNYKKYLSDLELAIEQAPIHSLKPYDPQIGCLVTNLSRMPVQKLNFGTGDPDFIFPLTIGRNSVAVLADKDNFLLRLVY